MNPLVPRLGRIAFWPFLVAVLSLHAAGDTLDNWSSNTFPNIALANCDAGGGHYITNGVPFMWRILFRNGVWLTAGTGPCNQDTPSVFLRSYDGSNWTRSTNAGHYNGFKAGTVTPKHFVGVAWAFVGFLASFSDDGVNWINSPAVDGTRPGAVASAQAVAYGLGRYVVVGASSTYDRGAIMYSSNGIAWATPFFGITATNAFTTIAFGNGVFWAGGPTRLFRSIDGNIFTPSAFGIGDRIIRFGNNRFLAAGAASLAVNTNGTDWVATIQPTATAFDTLTFGDGIFVATAGRDVAQSVDGFNWTVHTNALPRAVYDVAYGNGMLRAVSGTNYFVPGPVSRLTLGADIGTLWVNGAKQRQYDIQAVNDVTASNWPAVSRITLTNSPQFWIDPEPRTTNGSRFYRALLVP